MIVLSVVWNVSKKSIILEKGLKMGWKKIVTEGLYLCINL